MSVFSKMIPSILLNLFTHEALLYKQFRASTSLQKIYINGVLNGVLKQEFSCFSQSENTSYI